MSEEVLTLIEDRVAAFGEHSHKPVVCGDFSSAVKGLFSETATIANDFGVFESPLEYLANLNAECLVFKEETPGHLTSKSSFEGTASYTLLSEHAAFAEGEITIKVFLDGEQIIEDSYAVTIILEAAHGTDSFEITRLQSTLVA